MVAFVNIIRSVNALPLSHTKTTLWFKCVSGEERQKDSSWLETPIVQLYLFLASDRPASQTQRLWPAVCLLVFGDLPIRPGYKIMFIMLIIINQLPRSIPALLFLH